MVKAQAALEFMTTYGWVLLVVLAMLGALAYFDVFDFNRLAQERCVLSGELKCEQFTMSPSMVKMQIRNNFGKEINISAVECSIPDTTTSTTDFGAPFPLKAGEATALNCYFQNPTLTPKDKELVDVVISFNRVGSTSTHNITGEVLSSVVATDPATTCADLHGICWDSSQCGVIQCQLSMLDPSGANQYGCPFICCTCR